MTVVAIGQGGVWVKDPGSQQTIWVPSPGGSSTPDYSATPSVPGRSSRKRTTPTPTPTPPPTAVTSDVLKQSFPNEAAKQKAEAIYFEEQKQAEIKRIEAQAQQRAQQMRVQQIDPETGYIEREEFYRGGLDKPAGELRYPRGRDPEFIPQGEGGSLRFEQQTPTGRVVQEYDFRDREVQIMESMEVRIPELQTENASDVISQVQFEQGIKQRASSVIGDVKNFFGEKVSSVKETVRTSKDPVIEGYRNIFSMGKDIVSPTYQTIKGTGKIVADELVIPTLETTRMITRDIVEPSKQHLETVYGKPEDVSATRWISTAVPKSIGGGVTSFFERAGMEEKKIDISMLKDIIQPSITTAGYSVDMVRDAWRIDRKKEITQINIPSLPSTVMISPSRLGKGVEYTTRVGQYFVPYYGSALIFGSAVESFAGGPLGGERTVTSYVKAHPVEATVVGVYGGVRAYPFVSGYLRTIGREKVPVNIVPEKIISGKQTFWSEGKGSIMDIAKTHLSLFKSREYGIPVVTRLKGYTGRGTLVPRTQYAKLPVDVPLTPYHATGSIFWKDGKFVVGESPLHVAPGLSVNFLRISGETGGSIKGLMDSLTAPFKRSGALVTYISKKDILLRQGYEAKRGIYAWKGATPPAGKLIIPVGGKTEVQGIYIMGTEGALIQQKYYGVWKGVRYPIDEFKILKEGEVFAGTTTKFISEQRGIYSGLPSTSSTPYRGLGITQYSSATPSPSITFSSISPSIKSVQTSYSFIKTTPIKPSYTTSTKSSRVTPSYSSVSIAPSSVVSNIVPPSKITVPSSTSKINTYISSIIRGSSSGGGGSSTRIIRIGGPPPPPPQRIYPFKTKRKEPASPFGKFAVSLRRFGKFKVIGYGKTEMEALGIGKQAAATTLGATFKVEGLTKVPTSVPGFKTKKTKEGLLFIELPKYRLSKQSEIKEIQYYKGLKGGKKK